MNVIILDTETTGLTPKDQVVELAYMVLDNDLSKLNCASNFNQRYKPSAKMNPYAQAVHGIAFRELLTCPSTNKVEIPVDTSYMIGHNIAFDVRMLKQSNIDLTQQLDNIKYICTKELIKVVGKEFKLNFLNHKLDTIILHYFPDSYKELIPTKHAALSDCNKCFLLIKEVLKLVPAIDTWDKLYNLQQDINKDTYK
jgi:exodeoxyribonuclease X